MNQTRWFPKGTLVKANQQPIRASGTRRLCPVVLWADLCCGLSPPRGPHGIQPSHSGHSSADHPPLASKNEDGLQAPPPSGTAGEAVRVGWMARVGVKGVLSPRGSLPALPLVPYALQRLPLSIRSDPAASSQACVTRPGNLPGHPRGASVWRCTPSPGPFPARGRACLGGRAELRFSSGRGAP